MKKAIERELSFKIGDMAVYPVHGVGEVTGIESHEIGGSRQTFYILQIMDTRAKILIPTNNVRAVGLRQLIAAKEVPEVYKILRKKEISVDTSTWNRRQREYMDKIRTGSVFEIANVFRDLSLLKTGKDLSFGERKMLDTARNLLVKEVSLAQNATEDKVVTDFEKIFQAE